MLLPLFAFTILAAFDLPKGPTPDPVSVPHFPDAMHAFIWRNWQLVPAERMAETIGASKDNIIRIGRAMGLDGPPKITSNQQRRSYITIIRRNWHLLPYEQLLKLLGWTEEKLAFTLREDDFLYVKLGSLKPKCPPIRYADPDQAALKREAEIADIVKREFPNGAAVPREPLFDFVRQLSERLTPASQHATPNTQHLFPNPHPRFCYSYFALYGDPLLEKDADPYPEGYLARLAQSGVNGVWLQAVLYKLAPFPFDEGLSSRYKDRLYNLRALVNRARKYGIDVYLYFNEPRAMPLDFYNNHPELKGVTEGDHAALCTSAPEIQRYIQASVESICRAVPDLGGIFTITASENLTNCWSHGRGAACPRCGKRTPADVIAEVNTLLFTGIQKSGAATRLIAWDWGWADSWTEDVIRRLPTNAWLMSVSEWSVPIERGGIKSEVGEYSLSTIGPGPRASRNWAAAKQHGMRTIAKVQASNSWESSAVPYVPAVDNAYMHSAALDKAGIDGIMLGWTLGGYPSPNLEVVGARSTLLSTGKRRFGAAAPAVVKAWKEFSEAFRQFPFNVGTVYSAPLQVGPANLLWGKSTGYAASMVGIPYDDLESWRSIYPPEIFANQLQKVAAGFEKAVDALKFGISSLAGAMTSNQRRELAREIDVADAAAIHFRSVANQARFIYARESLSKTPELTKRRERIAELSGILTEEISLAKRLHAIQTRDSRIGFEATNQYYYVPTDLAEKVINCQYLLNRWLPELAGRNGAEQSGNSHQK